MVQDYYKNPVIGSSMLMFHKPDKDLKMNFKMDPYDEHMDEKGHKSLSDAILQKLEEMKIA